MVKGLGKDILKILEIYILPAKPPTNQPFSLDQMLIVI